MYRDPCSGAIRGVVSGVAYVEGITGDAVCCGAAVYAAVDGGVVSRRTSDSTVGGGCAVGFGVACGRTVDGVGVVGDFEIGGCVGGGCVGR